MPKKTREEKILARLRRLEQKKNETPTVDTRNKKTQENTISLDLDSLKPNSQTASNKIDSLDYSFVVKDLRKTALFVIIAVAFEVGLSLLISSFDIQFPRFF